HSAMAKRHVHAAARGQRRRPVRLVCGAGEGIRVVAPIDVAFRKEDLKGHAGVHVRAYDAVRKGELRSDSSDEQVVSGRDIDLDATADRRAERDALRLLAVTADADVGSKGKGAGVVEPEQAC